MAAHAWSQTTCCMSCKMAFGPCSWRCAVQEQQRASQTFDSILLTALPEVMWTLVPLVVPLLLCHFRLGCFAAHAYVVYISSTELFDWQDQVEDAARGHDSDCLSLFLGPGRCLWLDECTCNLSCCQILWQTLYLQLCWGFCGY